MSNITPLAARLPALRQDLRLERSAAEADGGAQWVVYDPLRHTFVQLNETALRVLRNWHAGDTPQQLAARLQAGEGVVVTVEQIADVVDFMRKSELAVDAGGGWRRAYDRRRSRRRSLVLRLLHAYLFFRVPLLRPEGLLRVLAPLARPLASPLLAWAAVACAILGWYLISRNWTDFSAATSRIWSIQGAASGIAAYIILKFGHEVAHAFAAHWRGLRVPSLGVAFMVGMPLLYADVSDAWRLADRRARMAISAAGVRCELTIGGFSTLLFAMLPDGTLREASFFVVAVAVLSSLLVNLNPLMKFDGYHLLADALAIDNLQPRAFALARWQLREILFALDEPKPEELSAGMTGTLVVFAWATWIYRALLFLGIALLVYAFFFKVLGLALFVVEIAWFILRPLRSEFGEWWQRRRQVVSRGRGLVSAGVLAGVVIALCLPFSAMVRVPALMDSGDLARIFPKTPGQIAAVHVRSGQQVAAGDVLMTLRAPELEKERELNEIRISLATMKLARLAGDPQARSDVAVGASELAALVERRSGLAREVEALQVRAPIAGRIVDFDPRFHVGRNVGRGDRLATIVAAEGVAVRGYVAEEDLPRLAPGTDAVFVPDDPNLPATQLVLREIDQSGAQIIDVESLAEPRGGPVPAILDSKGAAVATASVYLARFTVAGQVGVAKVRRGLVHVSGERRSIAGRLLRRAAMIAIRESGV